MKIFETSDFHTVTTLCTLGFAIECINKTNPNRYIFEFLDSPALQKHLKAYQQGLLRLDPRIVLINAKLVKDRMYEK